MSRIKNKDRPSSNESVVEFSINKTPLNILQNTKELIKTPESWCKHSWVSDGGKKHCIMGAFNKFAHGNISCETSWWMLCEASYKLFGTFPSRVNDEETNPYNAAHANVMKILDLAIETAKQLEIDDESFNC